MRVCTGVGRARFLCHHAAQEMTKVQPSFTWILHPSVQSHGSGQGLSGGGRCEGKCRPPSAARCPLGSCTFPPPCLPAAYLELGSPQPSSARPPLCRGRRMTVLRGPGPACPGQPVLSSGGLPVLQAWAVHRTTPALLSQSRLSVGFTKFLPSGQPARSWRALTES